MKTCRPTRRATSETLYHDTEIQQENEKMGKDRQLRQKAKDRSDKKKEVEKIVAHDDLGTAEAPVGYEYKYKI